MVLGICAGARLHNPIEGRMFAEVCTMFALGI